MCLVMPDRVRVNIRMFKLGTHVRMRLSPCIGFQQSSKLDPTILNNYLLAGVVF